MVSRGTFLLDTMPHVFKKQTVQLFFAVLHAHAIAGVDDPDECVCLLKVVPPIWAKRALPTDVPCG